jgi:hypothetical protein
LVVAIYIEVNELGRLEREKPPMYLWGVLNGFSGEALALYQRRYVSLLSAPEEVGIRIGHEKRHLHQCGGKEQRVQHPHRLTRMAWTNTR